MPELPEVETVRRGLAPSLEGHVITKVLQRRPDLRIPFPERFVERLEGRRVRRLDRRAKYILAFLDSGEVLIIHLGMSGRFQIIQPGRNAPRSPGAFYNGAPAAEAPGLGPAELGPHDHVIFETDAGERLIFQDHRRFGLMTLAAEGDLALHPLLAAIGPEPLGPEFTPERFMAALRGRKTSIKAALLDQKIVAGVGNIYACEALFRAGISPRRRADTIAGKGRRPTERCRRLVAAVREVLAEAIEAGGSTLRDYAQTDGELGYFQHNFRVYDRAGKPCVTTGCSGTIKRIVQNNRSTFYCPVCQR